MAPAPQVIDALDRPFPAASIGTSWELVSDGVMGGRSRGRMTRERLNGRPAIRLRGEVSLENNGGFLQIALNLSPDGGPVDACRWAGLELDVIGNAERYNLHLRTTEVTRPWQSYRQGFVAERGWRTLRLPFDGFAPHRLEAPLDPGRLRRIGIVAIGRAFTADIALGGVRFHG